MEPANTESGQEVAKADYVKVCVLYSFNVLVLRDYMILILAGCLSIPRYTAGIHIQTEALVLFMCFPTAPYLMTCKLNVKVCSVPLVNLCPFFFSSALPAL